MNWEKYFIASPVTPSSVLRQFLWYNIYIEIDSKAVCLKLFSTKNITFITQLFNTDRSVKNWNILKTKYALQNKNQFCWLQLINAIPKMWKKCIKQTSENTSLLVIKDHLLRGLRIIILEKLTFKELYSMLVSAIHHQPTSEKYFDNLFSNFKLPWKKIYLTSRNATANSHLRCFNYEVINNVFYLNKKFFTLVILNLLCILFVILKLKQNSTFFVNVPYENSLEWSFIIFWNSSWLSWFNTAGFPF